MPHQDEASDGDRLLRLQLIAAQTRVAQRTERVETVALLKSIARGRTMIIIDHDMDSLFELVERVTVLQEGRVLVEGAPDEIKTNPKVQEAYLGGVRGEAA